MAALSTQTLPDNGAALTYSPVAATDTAEIGSGHNTFAHYKNGSATAMTVTVVVPGNTFFGAPTPDNGPISIPAGGDRMIPLRKDYDDGTGRATITTSAQTTVTVAIVRVN